MGSLISNIPVIKPQQTPVVLDKNKTLATSAVSNAFPQIAEYSYVPAEPLSPARTRPRGVKAQRPSGKLIKENIFQSAGSTIKSYANISKHFLNAAFNGEVNAEGSDYYVGKTNDLAIRAGSLGIATILATTKLFPFAKGMEFIGFGTWFASMALWPRIIGAPIKWKTGVDINQKYEDSYGRRKMVYEDNQYRPMDLFRFADINGKPLTEKEYYKKYKKDYIYLDKLGDKLGIPRHISNRNEATMNKSGQVAVQGKTLWMMTAGVMTPVLSSVIADGLQTPFKNFLESYRFGNESKKIQALDSKLDVLLDVTSPFGQRNIITDLDKISQGLGLEIPKEKLSKLEKLMGGQESIVDRDGLKKIQKLFKDKYQGTGFYDAIEKSLKYDFSHEEPMVSFTENIYNDLKKASVEAVQDALAKMNKSFVETLPNEVKNYQGISFEDFEKIKRVAKVNTNDVLDVLKTNTLENVMTRVSLENFTSKGIDEDAITMISDSINSKVNEVLKSKSYHPLSKDKLTKLFKFAETNLQLQQKLEQYQKATIMNIAESITANNWEKLPPKYLEALNFTKQELAQFATINPSEASAILSTKLDKIVANPTEYQTVLEKMSKLAKEAISKEEKAVLQLIGTADTPGTLSKVKDLMQASGNANIGPAMEDSIRMTYKSLIYDVQKKIRNTIDSFVRPIKALDTFKNIEKSVLNILGENVDAFNHNKTKPEYHMFSNMNYEEAKKSLTEYIKDIVLDKNDINNWTTKFEHDVPGAKRGLKNSLKLVKDVANVVNGDLAEDTAKIVGENFAQKCNINNTVMRYRFLNLEYRLAKDFSTGSCYMQVKHPAENLVKDMCEQRLAKLPIFEALIDERKAELTLEQISKLKEIRDTARKGFAYHVSDWTEFYKTVMKSLDFGTSNKSISEMAGKNVTDFFVNAAQNVRSRNQWMKFAYGLLIGTTALSALFIANIGKKNYFNKDKYEYKNLPQGANK